MDIESLPPVPQTLSDEEDEEMKVASVAPSVAASADQPRAVQAHTAETLPVSKLLNYVKKLDLIAFVGSTQYAAAEQSLRESLGKPNITVKDVKKLLAADADFVARLRGSPLGNRAFAKYRDAVSRLKEADRDRAKIVRRGMNGARRRYMGCLATKIEPQAYEDCLGDFDDTKYDGLKLVPSALKQRVYETTDDLELRGALATSVGSRSYHASDLPSGLRRYIQQYPTEFKAYFDERKHELGLMKSVLRNLNPQVKRQLRRHFQENKRMSAAEFRKILEGSAARGRSPRGTKRVRGRGERSVDTASVWTTDTSFSELLD